MIRSGGFIFAFVLLAFLGAELWFINKLCDSLPRQFIQAPRSLIEGGKQLLISPDGSYHPEPYKVPIQVFPAQYNQQAEMNKVLDLIEAGKY